MGIAEDLINRAQKLAMARQPWQKTWIDIARLVIPTESVASAFSSMLTTGGIPTTPNSIAGSTAPSSQDHVRNIYDNTGLWAVDRLAAGMESLVTPQSEKWHGLTISDINHGTLEDEETAFLDKLRNFQFNVRYDPRAGFTPSHQKAMRSCISFGTGIVYTEEGDQVSRMGETPCPIYYYYCPVNECLLGVNDRGEHDTNIRVSPWTPRQLAKKFGKDKLSTKVQQMLDNKRQDEFVTIIHAVCPREEMGSSEETPQELATNADRKTTKGSPIASYYIEWDTKHLIADSGYFEFPYAIYSWLQQDNGAYSESPVMLALSEIKSLQAMGKSELRAFAQWTDPPLGVVNDGVMNRPNLNPRAVNIGAVGPDGSMRLKPILTAQNPDFAEKVMETRRMGVRETLYLNLFQILIKHPEMTATEAMLRANEKGELLGPAGGKIQAALSRMADRELGILTRRGLFNPKGSFIPPESLQGKTLSVRFTSPLDRLRRANEAVGITRLLEAVAPLAKFKPAILDNFDEDDIVRQLRDIYGAPASIIVPAKIRDQKRQATEQQQKIAQMAPVAKTFAEAARAGAGAMQTANETAAGAPQGMDGMSEVLNRMRNSAQSGNMPPGAAPAPGTDPNANPLNQLLAMAGKPPAMSPAMPPQLPGR